MSRHHTLAEIRKALEAYRGCVYLAAESLGVWPQAVYARIQKSAELQQLMELADGRRTDTAVLKLEQAIRAGDPWAVKFQLKTKGRDRGYVERQEVETSGRIQLEVEPKIGPELKGAIQRTLDVLAAGSSAGPLDPGDTLPPDFPPPD
ncbi:MAG: hypothetical protein ACYC6T_09725 [Thermoleophilia bacterium]